MFKKSPNTFLIVFFLIIAAAALTWIVPGGEYQYPENSAPVFKPTESSPQTWHIFLAIQKGFAKQASIIVFVLIIGGVFWIINSSKAIDAGIFSLLNSLGRLTKKSHVSKLVVSQVILLLIMLTFSIFGAVFGMSEETIAFVAFIIPITISLGYDSLTGVLVVFVAAGLGFAGAILNPFTIGIAQGISGLPLFSGLNYRLFCWLVINMFGFTYILIYTGKVFKNPAISPVFDSDSQWREQLKDSKPVKEKPATAAWFYFGLCFIALAIFSFYFPMTQLKLGNSIKVAPALPVLTAFFLITGIISLRRSVQYFILNMLAFLVLYLIVGVLGYDWYINEISALFLAGGILTGLVLNISGAAIANELIAGAKDIFGAAVIIGMAGGIIIILEEGKIIHTLLYKASETISGFGKVGTIGGMYGIQTLLNLILPSGSAKAAITMPIMAPFSDLVNLSRQASVMAFQFGDGFTNMITPVSPVLMAVLGVSKIPYAKWFRWIFPFVCALVILGLLLLIPTVYIELSGF